MVESKILSGIPASPGIGMGKAFLLDREKITIEKRKLSLDEVEKEIERFKKGIEETKKELLMVKIRVGKRVAPEQAKIFDFQLMILEDEVINNEVIKKIKETLTNAEFVYRKTIEDTVKAISSSKDDYIKERVFDIEAVSTRLLSHLLGVKHLPVSSISRPIVLLARSLGPVDVVHMKKELVLGFATDLGGGTSHVALLAKSLGIPAVVGLKDGFDQVKEDEFLIIDGDKGVVILSPEEKILKEYESKQEKIKEKEKKLLELVSLPGETLDGKKIEIGANVELPGDVEQALNYGAGGVGLFRTEYLYLSKSDLPSEEEQTQAYKEIAERMYPKSVVLRTFDLGGDKFGQDHSRIYEANPFLGWRAIRACLAVPEIFKVQLRAMMKASFLGNIKIMFPMISGVEELKEAKSILEEVNAELKSKKISIDEKVEIGIMVEIPSACLVADSLAQECDFFSIGTNDLIQYTLAVDRGNERVAHLYQAFHPSVLRLIKDTIDAGHRHNIWVGLCGEMAASPFATVLLVGMGIDELSCGPLAVPQVKKVIRSIRYEEAKEFADEVLKQTDLSEIKKLLESDYKKRFGAEEIICLY